MTKLDHVATSDLREALDGAGTAKAAKRRMVALSYKAGESVDDLSERFGIPRSTLYYWLDRFESESIEEAVTDEDRPGRPTKLDPPDWDRLREHLEDDPADHGLPDGEWTAAAVRDHVEREFDVSYSEGHVRRLLREGVI
jgi:transposase